MPFIYEKIDDATQLELLKAIPRQSILVSPRFQVIDRDRDIRYVHLGGRGSLPTAAAEPPDHHALIWTGQCITFESHETSKSGGGLLQKKITITALRIPPALQSQRASIERAIEDSRNVYESARLRNVAPVSIQFQN